MLRNQSLKHLLKPWRLSLGILSNKAFGISQPYALSTDLVPAWYRTYALTWSTMALPPCQTFCDSMFFMKLWLRPGSTPTRLGRPTRTTTSSWTTATMTSPWITSGTGGFLQRSVEVNTIRFHNVRWRHLSRMNYDLVQWVLTYFVKSVVRDQPGSVLPPSV